MQRARVFLSLLALIGAGNAGAVTVVPTGVTLRTATDAAGASVGEYGIGVRWQNLTGGWSGWQDLGGIVRLAQTAKAGRYDLSLIPGWITQPSNSQLVSALSGILTLNDLTLTLDFDPEVIYGTGVFNPTPTPRNFEFVFVESFPVFPAPYSVTSTFGATLTDIMGNGATLTPVNPSSGVTDGDGITEMHHATLSEDSGFTLVSLGRDLGTQFSVGARQTVTQSWTETGVVLAGDPARDLPNYLRIDLAFNLSGLDAAGFTGAAQINVIPLPAGVWLLGLGMAGLLGLRSARREDEPAPGA